MISFVWISSPCRCCFSSFNNASWKYLKTKKDILRRAYRRNTACHYTGNKSGPHCTASPVNKEPSVLPQMSRYPKSLQEQEYYINLVVEAVNRHDASSALRKSVTLLLPDLNPELDIYDRRFLLRLVWGLVRLLVLEKQKRVRIVVQGPSVSGGIPLAVAGLLRYLNEDYQISRASWDGKLQTHVSISTLGECLTQKDIDQDYCIVITPTNAVSTPITEQLFQLTQKYSNKPILLINPSLKDVPSTDGIMQVRGRKERMEFIETFEDVFYLRPLYKTGTLYPIQGVLLRKYPSPWEVWKMNANGNLTVKR
ncbi:Adenylate kinase 5, chloroplastic [Galdieria sulphuraria]|nr:Adenylate kinase 5, chloroplastic [Galdieria sulphuraria]